MRTERGEIWQIDFGVAAKVRPALLLTGDPEDDELDLFTLLLHTTALRGNQWELEIRKPFLKEGAFHFQQVQSISGRSIEVLPITLAHHKIQRAEDTHNIAHHVAG